MKKILIIVLFLACLLGLVGCDPGRHRLDANELLSNTVRIELVHYENTNPKVLRIGRRKTPIFDFCNATPIATLADSHIEEVVKDIAARDLYLIGRTLNQPIGKTLILYQRDGNMIVLFGCAYENKKGDTKYYGMCNIFDENGQFVEYLGDISHDYVDTLEAKYFEGDK